jgi:hypothetical protein
MVWFNCTTACRTISLDDVERYSNGRVALIRLAADGAGRNHPGRRG